MPTNEKGEYSPTCHGVPDRVWYDHVRKVRLALKTPEGLTRFGLTRIHCEDPDCSRLNRGLTMPAEFVITRWLDKIEPASSDDDKEKQICAGHPRQPGDHLCVNCAVVAMAKRSIDEEKHDTEKNLPR